MSTSSPSSSSGPQAPNVGPESDTLEPCGAHGHSGDCPDCHQQQREDDDDLEQQTDEEFEVGGAPTVDSPTPEAIAELCAQCVSYVARSVGIPLDFTAETLSLLDHYLALVRPTSEERPALLTLIANAAGAYFGELVRQRIDGFWLMPSQDVHDWFVCARSVYFKFSPIGVVHEVIAQSTKHSGPGGEFQLARDEQALIAERLAAVPAVAADHYYLLTTRLEAIDIVIETLRYVVNDGGQQLAFEAEDYE